MAAKRKGASAGSKRRNEMKKALAEMEKGHKVLQLSLKRLKTGLTAGHFLSGAAGHFGGITGGHFGGVSGGHFDSRGRSSKKAR
jgi:hypothetical protein